MGALLMSESCFGVPMGPISINYDFLEPLDPAMLVHPDEPSMGDYPNEPSMVDYLGLDPAMLVHPDELSMVVYPNEPSMEYPVGPVGHTGPDMNENIMGSRVRRSMVDYPMDPSMYPLMEYPMGSDGHTEPGKDDNMMGSRSRRSPRKLSMVENPLEPPMEYPMDPLMEYPMDLSMEFPVLFPSIEYPTGPGEHTGPDMEDNMMGARSRRSPREPCNQQTIPEILKCFERQG